MRVVFCGRWNRHSSAYSETKEFWRVREAADHGRVHDAEHGGGEPDSQGQRQHRDSGDGRLLDQQPNSVTQVLSEVAHGCLEMHEFRFETSNWPGRKGLGPEGTYAVGRGPVSCRGTTDVQRTTCNEGPRATVFPLHVARCTLHASLLSPTGLVPSA